MDAADCRLVAGIAEWLLSEVLLDVRSIQSMSVLFYGISDFLAVKSGEVSLGTMG